MKLIKEVRIKERNKQEMQEVKYTPMDLLRTKKLRKRALIVFFVWYVTLVI
jgi:hypothetical protein